MYTHLMYALIAVALYFIYKRFTLYLRYLNFQITVLQRMILEPLYDERERIRGLIEKDNDPDWVRIGVDKEDEVTNQIKDRFMKAIDKTLDEDNNAQTAIKAIRVSGRLEIFDTVFPLYQIFSSDIEKRFKARHSKPQF